MTENRRIFFNIVATYIRSLYGLVCGLLTGRWVLNALGEVDYGLWGVIGCIVAFIAFFNGVMAAANSRFYAIAIGEARSAADKNSALEECQRWFNTALTIHMVLPIALVAVGYPIGEWAIREWLNIPREGVASCVWSFRFVCLATFVSMVNVPFTAMYQAKQYIAELTVYSFITTTLNVFFGFYMVSHPGKWLGRYAIWTCLVSVVPNLIIAFRAIMIFPECAIRLRYMCDRSRLLEIGKYTMWTTTGQFCAMVRSQGISILINKFFGPIANASMTVANSVNGHACTLAGSLRGAISPAITAAWGAGEWARMQTLVFTSCKFSLLASLVFIIPLSLELETVLVLWLKNPPQYAIGLCWSMMAFYVCDVCTSGHMVAVTAVGILAGYYKVMCAISIFTLPLAALVSALGFGVYSVGCVLVFMIALNSLGRIYFARRLAGISGRYWLSDIMLPVLVTTIVCFGCGWSVRLLMEKGFLRVVATTVFCLIPYVFLAWMFVLNAEEREFVRVRFLLRIKARFFHG